MNEGETRRKLSKSQKEAKERDEEEKEAGSKAIRRRVTMRKILKEMQKASKKMRL